MIKKLLAKAGNKAANAISDLSVLSSKQLEDIDKKRDEYLNEMPSADDIVAVELTNRLIAAESVEIYNAYLKQLHDLYIPLDSKAEYSDTDFKGDHNIRYVNITKWVTDKEENSLEKLVNVYQVLSNENCNIALVFHRKQIKTEVYLCVINNSNDSNNSTVNSLSSRILSSLKGNFPGAEWNEIKNGRLPFLNNDKEYSVATATNIPTEKSKKFISQTVEKLLDGIIPENNSQEYTLILLATPVNDLEDRKLRLTEFYSNLYPYSKWSTNFTYTTSEGAGSNATFGLNAGVSAGIQNGQSNTTGKSNGTTDSTTDSTSHTDSTSTTHSEGTTKSTTKTTGNSISGSVTESVNAGVKIGPVNVGGGIAATETTSKSKSISKGISKSISDSSTNGFSDGVSKAIGKAINNTVSKSKAISKSVNFGGNFGANFARSSNFIATIGKNEGITQNFTNFNVDHTLELLKEQMKRYEKSAALGMWDFAAYVVSEDFNITNNVAHSYVALTQGEESFMSMSAINLWRGDSVEDRVEAKEICNYLRDLRHPIFGIMPSAPEVDPTLYVYPTLVTATTGLSGKELAYSLNFPRKSVAGLPVLQCAEFGRNIVSYEDVEQDIEIGSIFHMNHEEDTPVYISKNSLASHTFVTGSTGAGKSNTIYSIINSAREQDVNFLIVEPAKGEYKHVFDDVNVYGTNPRLTPLLRLNPFSFPQNTHILEHLDRLVEIFNVCWPMYAAMPAVLKNAIEKSYEDCGWNLVTSTNEYGDNLYPTFKDVTRNIRSIIDSSDYDAENKGAYKGSLITRLQSLSNGINGLIFTNDEISNEDLFEKDVIVDLSRVGSTETKSLLMGILVLKLQEYRMSSMTTLNSNLKHLTVLEEAHNLLKRTSTNQSVEGGNLQGKSVEMISNAIAEMRTYGEGFIIADQAPGLLDMSVIRNTNTKIIMRLPDQTDRELVGKAANLNDDQITELAKLPKGVAAIYQNEWIQPILCKVNKYEVTTPMYKYTPVKVVDSDKHLEDRQYIATLLSDGIRVDQPKLEDIKDKLETIGLDASIEVMILKELQNPPINPRMTKLAPLMSALYPEVLESVEKIYHDTNDTTIWTIEAENVLYRYIDSDIKDQVRRDIIQSIMTQYLLHDMNNIDALKDWIQGGNLS